MLRRRIAASPVALVATGALVLMTGGATTATAAPGSGDRGVVLTRIADVEAPVHAATAPGRANRRLLFVAEQGGLIRVIRNGRLLPKPFANLSGKISTGYEQGLLSIEFDPGYAKNRRLYAYMTDAAGDIRVSQLRRSPASRVRAKPRYDRRVITIPHPGAANHNGGLAEFGPDGHLYIGTGDGGVGCDPPNNAQNTESLLGKLLRIDPKPGGGYSIPKGNPYVGTPGADEIYSIGLRNPFRFSFDDPTGTIAIGDVGQAVYEEIDYLPLTDAAGANFGWDALEGTEAPTYCSEVDPEPTPVPAGTTPPIHQYGHSGEGYTGCAVIGGPVVRDRRLPTLRGRLLFSDSCNGEIQSLIPSTSGGTDAGSIGVASSSPSSIVAGRSGRIYVTDLSGGVFRIDPARGKR